MKVKIEFFLSGYHNSNQDWRAEVRRIIRDQVLSEVDHMMDPGQGRTVSAIYYKEAQIGRVTVE